MVAGKAMMGGAMFDRAAFWNTLPDGIAVLEVPHDAGERQFIPLRHTAVTGDVVGPLASLRIGHTFEYSRAECGRTLEALYRFPLPGDAAIIGVSVRFGITEISAELQDRERAEAAYGAAKERGQQAALITREAPNVFTLHLAGLQPEQAIVVSTTYAQLAHPTAEGWSLRLPLTTAPRYVRGDERGSRAAAGQPLAVLRDPGHRFALDLTFRAASAIASPTHALAVTAEGATRRVALRDGAVLPDRDCVIAWRPAREEARPTLSVFARDDVAGWHTYFLALIAPPAAPPSGVGVAREAILLVDHSGSMSGAKWEAADWATRRFLGDLTPRDTFALGLFHDRTAWLARSPQGAAGEAVQRAVAFLLKNQESGGTNLGVALEQALGLPRDADARTRHLLIITDAEVSDADRILRLADEEARRDGRRRISVLCIDAAPNAYLANALAERGGGVARFLTSAPEEGDIATALDELLADWAAPLHRAVRLTTDRAGLEGASGASVVAGGALALGDLPAGRALWAVGRVPREAAPPTFRAVAADTTLASAQPETLAAETALPALKALFGARRVLALEHLHGAGYDRAALRAELHRLGYDPAQALTGATGPGQKVYQENARDETQRALRALLVAEALRYGLISAETAFVAVRREAGERVAATVIVPNALPVGWSPAFIGGLAGGGRTFMAMAAMPPTATLRMAPLLRTPFSNATPPAQSGAEIHEDTDGDTTDMRAFAMPTPPDTDAGGRGALTLFSGVPRPEAGVATLFDVANAEAAHLPASGTLSRLWLRLPDSARPDALDPSLILELFVDDLAAPRVRVSLAAIAAQGGMRPLNLAWRQGQALRLILRDPSGICAAEGLSLAIALE